MSFISAIYFGLLQGLTEFLPVSSSGHLLLFRSLFAPYDSPLLLDIVLHTGSLLAILWFFKEVIFDKKGIKKLIMPLFVGTLPAILVGLLVYQRFQGIFSTPRLLGFSFLITSLFLALFSSIPWGKITLTKVPSLNAFIVGLFQALAIMPGISRSGSTIFAGRLQKFNQKTAFAFAFLLAVPAILGSLVLSLKDGLVLGTVNALPVLVGFLASFVSSLFALKLLQILLRKKNLMLFSVYTFLLGCFCLGVFL